MSCWSSCSNVGAMRSTIVALALILAGCSSGPPTVDWENHAPSVKRDIDAAAKAKDCDALQSAFDNADEMDDAQRNRTGNGNADLMAYIDAQLKAAGCYKE